MVIFPNAKINLGLRITARRTDGYHDIETVFYPVRLSDALEFVHTGDPGMKDEITVTGLDTGGRPEDNLVLKAAVLLRQVKPFPGLKIHLHKMIPSGAGLGGGSSDAANLLKALNRFYSLGLTNDELKSISLRIGSDCPFFIDNSASYATGRGEKLLPAECVLNGYHLVLLNPGVHISTREAYEACKPAIPGETIQDILRRPVTEWKGHLQNDFEEFAFRKFPLIAEIRHQLYEAGALFSLMTGSGSTVFGIFTGKPKLPDSLQKYLIYSGEA